MSRLDHGEAVGALEPRPAASRPGLRDAGQLTAVMNGVIFTDLSGRVIVLNPAAEQMAGVGALTAMSRPLSALRGTAGDLLDAVASDWEQTVREQRVDRVVEIHDGVHDLRYFRIDSAVIRDRRGQPAGVLVILQDVTEDHKIDQRRNQYLSIVAHELRTPLTGIKTFSTMLAKGRLGSLTPKQQEIVESIREQSIRLEQQIDNLVNMGSIEAKEHGQDRKVLDLVEAVRSAVLPLLRVADDKGLTLTCELPDAAVEVLADPSGVRRAMQALVENAIKFTRQGGSVKVSVAVCGDSATFTVEDDGIGIDPRYHRRIFEKFFQVEDPLTRHHGGAGLGLFVANGIVDAHGSRIEVTSALGRGAKFAFRLRIHAANADKGTS